MFSIKEYPDSFRKSTSKCWLKFKKLAKKKAHTQLRRGKMTKYRFNGWEIDW